MSENRVLRYVKYGALSGVGISRKFGANRPSGVPWRPKADILEGVGGGAPHDKCQGVWGGGSPPTLGPYMAQVGALAQSQMDLDMDISNS